MKTLLIATGNPSKRTMFQEIVKEIDDIEFLYLTDFPSVPTPIEDGKTVQENALIKAKYYFDKFGIPVLSDDAGFEIRELNNAPWVQTRRWWWELPDTVSDEDRLTHYLDKVKDIPWDRVHGAFPFCRCLYLWADEYFFQNEFTEFYLTKTPRRPFKPGRPTSAIKVLLDGRHELDVPAGDIAWQGRFKPEWLKNLLLNLK